MPRGVKRIMDTLTGGSGDVNPQEFVITADQAGADNAVTATQPLPIPRLPTAQGRNLVIEILWVQFFQNNPAVPLAGIPAVLVAALSTNPSAPTTIQGMTSDPRSLATWLQAYVLSGANYYSYIPVFYEEDLTDGAGHGILVATDNIYFHVRSANTGVANKLTLRFGYRWKEVTLTEYIGIVQSQQ